MPRDYKLYLSDMLEALERIQEYTRNITYRDFARSNITIDAVVRNLEVIGEAARKLPPDIKSRSPEIEWPKIVALRNILTHEYFGVNTKIVWDIVQNKLGPIGEACGKLMESL
jgi:uncharacterized protein with HEPN domain